MGTTFADPLLVLRFPPPLTLTQAQFYEFCLANPEVKMELTAQGEVVIVPTGWNSSEQGAEVVFQLKQWARMRGGRVAGPNAGFDLPSGATRSPDAAWIAAERFAPIPRESLNRFLPLCPDFVVEVRSASDRLKDQVAKMDDYMANGAQLAWLIDPLERRVHVYRPGQAPVIFDHPDSVSADPELPGFTLDLAPVWGV